MLKPHEIFSRMPRETAAQLFTFLLEKEKPLYRATIESLAKQRKLRPVFIERKPRNERHVWMQETLGKKNSDGIAAHLLQIWLVGAHARLLCDFLDGLGIKHDENGTVETLPPAPPKSELARVIETLHSRHDAGVVRVYLHAFHALNDEGWPSLAELLAEDERLRFTPQPAPA